MASFVEIEVQVVQVFVQTLSLQTLLDRSTDGKGSSVLFLQAELDVHCLDVFVIVIEIFAKLVTVLIDVGVFIRIVFVDELRLIIELFPFLENTRVFVVDLGHGGTTHPEKPCSIPRFLGPSQSPVKEFCGRFCQRIVRTTARSAHVYL